MSELAEQAGLLVVTDQALEKRGAGRFDGELDAQFQYQRDDTGLEAYAVECYDRDGFFDPESRYTVLLKDDFYMWASCGCEWFLKHYSRKTTCKHIYAAVMKHRKRHRRKAVAKAA